MNFEDSDNGLQQYLRDISIFPLLTTADEKHFAVLIRHGDEVARDVMIRSNLRLVVRIARDFYGLGMSLLDLVSEGNIGLVKAVERFDPRKGGKLSTYAAWWIKQSIKRSLANQSKTIRLPVHIVDKLSKIRRISMHLEEELGRDPTNEEIAEEIGIPPEKVAALRAAATRPASLDAAIGDEDSTELIEIVADEKAVDPFENLRDKNLFGEIDGLLSILDARERRVINERFGIGGHSPQTLEQVGEKFGVTRERIRQVQNIALNKLKRALKKKEEVSVFV